MRVQRAFVILIRLDTVSPARAIKLLIPLDSCSRGVAMQLCCEIYCNVTLELTRLCAQDPARLACKNSTCHAGNKPKCKQPFPAYDLTLKRTVHSADQPETCEVQLRASSTDPFVPQSMPVQIRHVRSVRASARSLPSILWPVASQKGQATHCVLRSPAAERWQFPGYCLLKHIAF